MERRETLRYVSSGNVGGQLPRKVKGEPPVLVSGRITNLSCGGACATLDRYIEPLKVLLFRFGFPDIPALLPVLVQVRWVEPSSSGIPAFRTGLLFIA